MGTRPTPDGYRLAARAFRLADRLGLPVLSLVDTPGADPSTSSEEDGLAVEMGIALDALLACHTPTLAYVHGEGGSGGALAAATTDLILLGPDSYFAAIGPEGASAALRRTPQECADAMGITPAALLELGFADGLANPEGLLHHLVRLVGMPDSSRLQARRVVGVVPSSRICDVATCVLSHPLGHETASVANRQRAATRPT